MSNEECVSALREMADNQLFYVLRDALEDRIPMWAEATEENSGRPTQEAKLAVIRHILCE